MAFMGCGYDTLEGVQFDSSVGRVDFSGYSSGP
jgi:hypothetical protein